jgi:hypothetical protein
MKAFAAKIKIPEKNKAANASVSDAEQKKIEARF